MRQANKAIIREKHPLPTMDDMLPNLRNSKWFTKLDIRNAFHQVEISENSRHITTFISKKGLFRYTRLMFGISCAPELFQKVMEKLLVGCDGCIVYIDDILIFAKNEHEHDKRLERILNKLKHAGVLLNKEKSKIKVKKVTFLGHILDENGIKPSEDRIDSLRNFRQPSTVEETRSFLGLINYVGRFIPCLSTLAEPLYRIIKKVNKFVWDVEQENAFKSIKAKISNIDYLGYYNPIDVTHVIADASPVGLGAVLVQFNGRGDPRIIAFANKTLTDVEKRYCQTEKEALAIVWAVERFHIYLFGKHFYLLTDHKPLQTIFGTRSKPSARIERWVLRLQSYNYSVIHIAGKTNIADPLSRLCELQDHPIFDDQVESCVNELTLYSVPVAIPYTEVKTCSENDEETIEVLKALKSNAWGQNLLNYKIIKDELAEINGILIRGTRIVIPSSLRDRVLTLAHEGHPGMSVMKSRIRTKVWWPKIDRDVEKKVKTCKPCLQVSLSSPPEPMKRRKIPDRPWKDLAVDYLGPLPSGHYILVVIDYFSRFFEIKIMTSITTKRTITELREIFSRFGIPFSLTADNGPQFRIINSEFREFCKQYGIILFNTTPEWPQQNGLVERQNRGLLKRLKISQINGSDWRSDLLDYLLMYRSTPLTDLGKSPSELLFSRNILDKIPQLPVFDHYSSMHFEEICDKDAVRKEKSKLYADDRRGAKLSTVLPGDTVLIREKKKNKLSPNFGSEEYLVIDKNGSELTVKSKINGHILNRNSSHTKKIQDQNEKVIDKNVTVDGLDDDNVAVDEPLLGLNGRCNELDNESDTSVDENLSQEFAGFPEEISNDDVNYPIFVENNEHENLLYDSESSYPERQSRPKRKRVAPKKFDDYVVGCNEINK